MKHVLILHGALGAKDQFEDMAQLLESKYQVHLINFSGHGGEPFSSNGFGIEIFAEEVLSYINQNKLTDITVLGYSMGGYVALWCAAIQPYHFKKIITLGTKFDWSPESAAKEVSKMNPEKIQEKVPAFARLLNHRHLPNDWKILMQKTADMMIGLGRNPLLTKEVLFNINIECKVLLGDKDDMADRQYSEQVASWLPYGNFKLLENTPHPIEKVNLVGLIDLIE